MKKADVIASGVILAVLTCGSEVFASDQVFLPPQVCTSSPFTFLGAFGEAGNFVDNVFANATIHCGIGQDQSASDSNDDVRIYFSDLNPSGPPGVVNFRCSGWEVSYDNDLATISYIGQKYGCSFQGGCPNDPGQGYASSNYITFEDIRHGGGFSTVIDCSIPAVPLGTTFYSVIKSFYLVEQ